MENPGILSLIQMNKDERDLFLDYMKSLKDTYYYDVLYTFFEDDFFEFLDLFAGESVRVPQRHYIMKVVKYVKIYCYCKERGFTEESYRKASKIWGKRKSSVKRAINKVERVLRKAEKGEEVSLDEVQDILDESEFKSDEEESNDSEKEE